MDAGLWPELHLEGVWLYASDDGSWVGNFKRPEAKLPKAIGLFVDGVSKCATLVGESKEVVISRCDGNKPAILRQWKTSKFQSEAYFSPQPRASFGARS